MYPKTNLRRAGRALSSLALSGLGGSEAPAHTLSPADRGPELLGDEPSYLDLGVGVFNIQGHRSSTAAEGRIEFRYGQKLRDFGPAAGFLVDTRGGVFGYSSFIRPNDAYRNYPGD